MKLHTLKDLLILEIQDLYDAEKQIFHHLPKLINKVADKNLQEKIEQHHNETKEHIKRLEKVCSILNIDTEGKTCYGASGLLKEADEILSFEATPEVMDAAIIGSIQRIEHYEIAGYSCAITYAEMLGFEDTAQILKETINEEERADKNLSHIAESEINEKAQTFDHHHYKSM